MGRLSLTPNLARVVEASTADVEGGTLGGVIPDA